MTTENDLEAALTDLTTALRKKRNPSRFQARAILLAIGDLALSGNSVAASAGAARLATAVGERAADWERAVQEEIELAAVEFVRSVDPKYLDHPRYDFAYTVGARERLEARLVGAEILGVSPPDALLDQISTADGRLAPHLLRTAGKGPRGSGGTTSGPDRPH